MATFLCDILTKKKCGNSFAYMIMLHKEYALLCCETHYLHEENLLCTNTSMTTCVPKSQSYTLILYVCSISFLKHLQWLIHKTFSISLSKRKESDTHVHKISTCICVHTQNTEREAFCFGENLQQRPHEVLEFLKS